MNQGIKESRNKGIAKGTNFLPCSRSVNLYAAVGTRDRLGGDTTGVVGGGWDRAWRAP